MSKSRNKLKSKVPKDLFILAVLILFVILAIIVPFIKPRSDFLSCQNAKTSIAITRDLYSLCFDKETKQPSWVLQFPDEWSFETTQNESPQNYYQDPDIPKAEQASELDYANSHWVMSSYLFPLTKRDEQFSGESVHDHSLFSVTSPQDPAFHHGYWEKLRKRVKTLALERNMSIPDHVGVLSGPLFLSESRNTDENSFGVSHIPVPTHFFQVIVPSARVDDIEAYIVPNKWIDEKTPLVDFQVTVKEFEKRAGIKGVKSIADDLVAPIPVPPPARID